MRPSFLPSMAAVLLAGCGGEKTVKVSPGNACASSSACRQGESCTAGRCTKTPAGGDPCAYVLCNDGEACVDGSCEAVCETGATRCGGTCVDTQVSQANCGGCGKPCSLPRAKAACLRGACAVAECTPGWDDCDGKPGNGCERDVLGDPQNCGRCGNVCPAPRGGEVAACDGGVCRARCAQGFVPCGGACRKTCDNWRWTNPTTSSNSLYAVTFADSLEGLAAGDKTLLRTVDGGATWRSLPGSPLEHVEAMHHTSRSHVVGVGFNLTSPQTGGVQSGAMTSDDGGQSFVARTVPIPPGDQLLDVHLDGAFGVAVGTLGTGGSVYATLDGGITWTDRTPTDVRTAPKGTIRSLHGVHVRGSRVWVVGDGGLVRFSTDGGLSWRAPTAPPPARLRGVQFVDDQNGLAVGYGEAIWRSEDGGATFTEVHAGPVRNWLRRVKYIDAQHVVAMGFQGLTLRSADGGSTWSAGNPYAQSYFFSMATQGSTMWAVGTRGVVFKSDDMAASWARQTPGYTASLWGSHFPTPLIGYAVGELGGILKTTDAGRSWAVSLGQHDPYALANPSMGMLGNCLHAVHFVSADEGWAVGDPVAKDQTGPVGDAVILHTRDGGTTWTEQASGVRSGLKAVGFSSPLKGWAVGTGVVLRTADGGATWGVQPAPTGTLTGVAALSDTEAWVSGHQVLAHTVDGGQSWTRVGKPLGILWSVRFFGALHGIAAGWGRDLKGGMEVTADGGRTWTSVTTRDANQVWAASLAGDLAHGAAATGGGRILRTSDGGRSWTLDAAPTFLGLQDVRAVNGGFVIVTEFGGILRGPTAAPSP